MRILHIINVRWFNATAWYALRLAKAGRDAGDEAAVAGLPLSPVIEAAKEYGLKTFEANYNTNNIFKIFNAGLKTLKFLKEFKPDVVVYHRGEMFWWFAIYKYICSPSWSFIRVRGDIRPPTTDFFSRFTHNKCTDAIIVSANIIREKFINGLKTPAGNVTTIYGGVDTSVFKPNEELRRLKRAELGYKPDDYVVSVVGRFDPVKGHEVFLKACSILYGGGMKNLRVLLAGFPENVSNEEIEEMIKENGLEDVAFITGKRKDIPAIMNACDLGIISSLGSEAICRVAMEFMASGVTVVASDAGVLPEMFSDKNSYTMYDSEALAQRIKDHGEYIKIYSESDFYQQFKIVCEKYLKPSCQII